MIVVDEPRLIWLKDTDGDDKADEVVELSDGWATDDTHHTIHAFEWSPGGLLHMNEGVSMAKRLKREEIIESILEPNARIDPKFVTTNITAADGHSLIGFVTAETADMISLKLPGGAVQEVKKAEVKGAKPSSKAACRKASPPECLPVNSST